MKIGVIGTINRDTIRLADGTMREGWGGILYNLVTLSALRQSDDEIFPVCNIGKDCSAKIRKILKSLKGVNLGYIQVIEAKNNHCCLTYHEDGEKSEILFGGVPPLSLNDILPLLDCDIILVNFISGQDISIDTLARFRRRFNGKFYIDIHSFTLGKRRDHSRFLRAPANWTALVDIGDYIQLNRMELALLVGKLVEGKSISSLQADLHEFIIEVQRKEIDLTGKVLLVTAGAAGAVSCRFSSNGRAVIKCHNAAPGSRIVDVTGAGDCFSAGFISAMSRQLDLTKSVACANEAARRRVSGSRIYTSISRGLKS